MKTASLHVVTPAPKAARKKKPEARPSLMDKAFKYVPAAETDIRKLFNRVRREAARGTK